jgi:competence protein ComEC
LLAALAAAVGAVAGIPWRARLLGMLGLVVLYVPLAGAGPSIQRAGVMGGATLVAALAGRPASRWWALGLAAATTLLLDPRAVGDPGWQLSFAAVLGLLLVAPRWREALRERGIARPLAEALAVTAAATAATAPIAAVTFGELSLVSLPANVLAAPAVAPVMWLGMLAVAVGQVAPALAAPPVLLAGLPLGFLVLVGDAAAAVPHAVLRAGPAELAAGAVALLLAVVAVRRRRRVGWRRAAPLAGAAAAVVLVTLIVVRARAPQPLPPPERLRITFLDVGQGDATLVQDRRASVLVDTGPPDADVVGQLRRAGARRLDLLVVTHAEADHEGGAAAVLAAVPVGLVLDGRDGNPSALGDQFAAVARSRGVRLVAAHAGQDLRVGSLRLRVVSPQAEPPERHAGGRTNDRAVVLDVRAAGRRVLLPADVESDVLSALPLAPVDVLKVSHHGSVDEGLPGLLERLRPRVAGIEVGRHNTYGHPAAPTLDALGSVPVVVRTDRDGAVRVDLHGDRWVVQKVGR